MTTFAQLASAVSRDLRDVDNKVFTTSDVADLINEALSEIGRIAPRSFQEDITPVDDTLEYTLQSAEFDGAAVPEIEVSRVELWDGSTTPKLYLMRMQPASGEYVNDSSTGWSVWNGKLYIPNWYENYIDPTTHIIRVWGYAPYAEMTDWQEVVVPSNEAQWAMRAYCRVGALQRLIMERDLFTQWQGRANNTDVTPAALMNGLSLAQEDWRRRSRALMVLRQAP